MLFALYKYHRWLVEMSFPVGEGDVWSLNMLRCKFQGLWLSNTAPQRRLPRIDLHIYRWTNKFGVIWTFLFKALFYYFNLTNAIFNREKIRGTPSKNPGRWLWWNSWSWRMGCRAERGTAFDSPLLVDETWLGGYHLVMTNIAMENPKINGGL